MSHRDHSPKGWSGLGGANPSAAETEDVFVFPVSHSQQRVWNLERLEPGRSLFNVPEAFRITGPLNVPVLQKTIDEIARRHEILRTAFGSVDGRPVQIVSPAKPLPLPAVDLRILHPGKRQAEAERLIEEEIQTPFDLGTGPLFRARLLCLDEREYILLINSHNIIADTGSREVFEGELAALYPALGAGAPSPLPELSIQYGDFAEWQRAAIQSEEMARQLAYWKDRLRGAPVLQLPADRPRPSAQSFQGAAERFELPASLADDLRSLSKRQGVTLCATLLAAFQALLSRYTGQGDIVVGSPVANRGQPGVENLIGLFTNTLMLRTDLSDDPRFSDFLTRARETLLGAFDNQDIPCEMLGKELHLEDDAGQNPLCRVLFVLRGVSRSERPAADLILSPVDIPTRTAKCDLTLSLFERAEGIDGSLNYNTDIFDAERIRRMATHFIGLLEAIVAAPHARISELPLLTGSGRRLPCSGGDPAARDPGIPPLARERPCVPAQGWLQLRLVEIWEDLLETAPIGITDDFFELGGNPLLASAMCSRVDKIIGRKLTPGKLSSNPTIQHLSEVFALTNVQSEGTKAPFFFLHGDFLDGGLYCINLVRNMAKDRPFYKIDPHGWDGRAMPSTIEAMAASHLELLLETQKEGPYFLGGYCNGGLVAFEMARQLEARGRKVACLILVLADVINVQFKPILTAVTLWGGMRRMNERARQQLFLKWRERLIFANASFRYHAAALREVLGTDISQASFRLRRKGGRLLRRIGNMMMGRPTGSAPDAKPAEAEIDVSRTYREAVYSYIPRRYDGKVFLLRQSEPDPDIRSTDPSFNWKKAVKRLTVHVVPGGHFTAITVYSNLTVLTERLQACLDEAEAELNAGSPNRRGPV